MLVGARRALIKRPLPIVVASGTVVFDAVGTEKHTAAGTSFTDSSLTIGAGSTRALVVVVAYGYAVAAPTSTAVTWGGTPMSLIETQEGQAGSATVEIWALRNPASGAQTLAGAWTNSCETFIIGVSYTGVEQSSDGAAFPHTAKTDSGASVSLTSAVGNACVGGYSPSTGAYTFNGTTLFNDASSGTFINAAANRDVGAAPTVTMGDANGAHVSRPVVAIDVKAA